MGGPDYDRDVYSSGSKHSSSGFHFSDTAQENINTRGLDSSVLPLGRTLICDEQCAVMDDLDNTGSMGDSLGVIFDKAPMFYGQIQQQGYLGNFGMSYGLVGDFNSDKAGYQVSDFSKGIAIDAWLKKLYLERGGGGQDMESYEMAAYFRARHVEFTHPKADKPFLFMTGDEAPYRTLNAHAIRRYFGDEVDHDISAKEIFDELCKKYHFFFLHVEYGGDDESVCARWRELIGQRFLLLHEPKSVVDVKLGLIATISGTRTMNQYVEDMTERGQSKKRIGNVQRSLEGITDLVPASGNLPALGGGKKRSGGSKRL